MKDKLKAYKHKFNLRQTFSWSNLRQSLQTTNAKQGASRSGVTVLVLAIVVVVNLIVGQLPETLNTIDLSEEQVTEVSQTSKDLLQDLDDTIVLKVLADQTTTDTAIKSFLEKYAASSKNVSIEWIDPVLHPSALTTYSAEENSVVIENETTEDFEVVSFSSIVSTGYDSSYNTVTTFDGDGQLTSAVNRLTNQDEHTVYLSTGHGEETLVSSITTLFDKANYTTAELNTVTTAEMPEDMDLLLIYGPTTDFTEDEITNLESYIADGGKVMVVLSAEDADTPNVTAFMKAYGLAETSGYIADAERSYQGQSYYLIPNITGTDVYLDNLSSQTVLLINTKGFTQVDPTIDNATVTPLLQTSENGYNVTDDDQMQGTYTLGAVVTQTTAEEAATSDTETSDSGTTDSSEEETAASEGKLTILSSTNLVAEDVTSAFTTLENNTVFMNMVTANFDDVENISIEAKTLSSNMNTVTNPGGYSLLFILIIPLAVLVVGFVIWFRRRRA
ncbi:GldG family protein [Enterococcus sp. RIT-PI-f]|uniref:GldG family protein n=1 Tax=Enterococcus sp. RIT-PI-f TaxID=1690244 RepID=UPI0006B9ABC4|nr:GldG family protein [Enterococcus sp. RIT-PI-f]